MVEVTVGKQYGTSPSGYDYSRSSSSQATRMGPSYYREKQLESGIRGSGYYDPETGKPVKQSMTQEQAQAKGYIPAEEYANMSETEKRAATRDWRASKAAEEKQETRQPLERPEKRPPPSLEKMYRQQGVWYPQDEWNQSQFQELTESQKLRKIGQQRAATLDNPLGKSYQETLWQIENLGKDVSEYNKEAEKYAKSRTLEEQKKMWGVYPSPTQEYENLQKKQEKLEKRGKILGFQLQAAKTGLIKERKRFSVPSTSFKEQGFIFESNPKRVKIGGKPTKSYSLQPKPITNITGKTGYGKGMDETLSFLGKMSTSTRHKVEYGVETMGKSLGVDAKTRTRTGYLLAGAANVVPSTAATIVGAPVIAGKAITDPIGTTEEVSTTIQQNPERFVLGTAGGAIMLSGGWTAAKSLARGGVSVARPSLPGSMKSLKGVKGVTVNKIKSLPSRLKTSVSKPVKRASPFYVKYKTALQPLKKPQYTIQRFDFVGRGKTGFGRIIAKPKWYAELRKPTGIAVKPSVIKSFKRVPSKIKIPFKTTMYKLKKASSLKTRQKLLGLPKKTRGRVKWYAKKLSPIEKKAKYTQEMKKTFTYDPVYSREGRIIGNLGTPRFTVKGKYLGEKYGLKQSWVKSLKIPPSKRIGKVIPKPRTAPSTIARKKWKSFMRQRELNYLDDIMKSKKYGKSSKAWGKAKPGTRIDYGKRWADVKKIKYTTRRGFQVEKTRAKIIELEKPSKSLLEKTTLKKGPLELTKKTGIYTDLRGTQKTTSYTGSYSGPSVAGPVKFKDLYKKQSKPKPVKKTGFKPVKTGRTIQLTKTKPVKSFSRARTTIPVVQETSPGSSFLFPSALTAATGRLSPDFTQVTTKPRQRVKFEGVSTRMSVGRTLKPKQEIIGSSKPMQASGERVGQATTRTQQQVKTLRVVQAPMPKTMVHAKTKLKQTQKTKSMQKTKPVQARAIKNVKPLSLLQEPPGEPPGEIPKIIPHLPFPQKKKMVSKPAFLVKVKKKGKWFSLGQPTPKNIAIVKGIKETASTAARSFKIEEKGTTTKKDIPFITGLHKYRRKKPRSKLPSGVFVEKTRYAIDSPGEKREITLKGLTTPRKTKVSPLKIRIGGIK